MKKSRVREILKHLGINNPEVEIYETEDFLSVISKFNNGKFYNFYNAEDDMAQYADKKIKKYITSIRYFLVNCETGYIRLLTTSDKLRKKTKENIINWLNEFQDSAFNEGVENQYWAEVKYEWSEDLESSDFIHICNVEEIEYIGEFIEEGEKHD